MRDTNPYASPTSDPEFAYRPPMGEPPGLIPGYIVVLGFPAALMMGVALCFIIGWIARLF